MKSGSLLSGLFLVMGFPLVASAEIVYDNSANDRTNRFEVGVFEVGDEITLGGALRVLDTFDFEFYYTNQFTSVSGSPTFEVTLYNNDGPTNGSGYATPGSVIWGSGTVSNAITAFTARNIIISSQADFGPSIVLPETFIWAVRFGNLNPNDEIGLDIYDPPVVGTSECDYWVDLGSGWELRQDLVDPCGNPHNFAARFFTVPEPSSLGLALLGGLAWVVRGRRS